jgi:predicted ATPase/DNA-binding SARP family transcriptional activator
MGDGAPPGEIRIQLLGGFAVTIDGAPVPDRWRLRKAKTLVKLLCLAPGRRLHRDAAIEQLWPDAEQSAATNNLHQAVHAARQILGSNCIALRDDVLTLGPRESVTVDVEVFERAAETARASGDMDALRAALKYWSGPLLPEDAYEAWCMPHRERLSEIHASLAVQLAGQALRDGAPATALAVLEPLVNERALDEPLQRIRMTALAEAGRRWDAIAAYEQLRDELEAEYAAEPAPETKTIYRRLLQGSTPASTGIPHNLPEAVSSFVGRARELKELAASLARTRLLTLSGPGGAGKSRLAIELARRAVAGSEHADGVWRIELAGVKQGELLPAATAAVLGLALPGGRPPEVAVAEQIADRSVLLVLDNCEHLLSATRALIEEVLARSPNVRILTTSREPVGIADEVVYRVPSLEIPAAQEGEVDIDALARHESVMLFIERATQTVPRFALSPDNAPAVVEICRRLDGMPLALELAAARLAHLSVTDLAMGLDGALTLLARRGGARLDRQGTLAATLDWSFQLLDGDERNAFRRLAVFAGGFDLAAAGAICEIDGATTMDVISRLVDKSLVEAETAATTARYRLLEVVRQYAEAQLDAAGDAAGARRRHRQWFAEAAAQRDSPSDQPIVGEPSSWFDTERDNLRAALASALDDDAPLALRLAACTWRFWMSRGLIAEGAQWLTAALDRCPDPSLERAWALVGMAVLQTRQGRVLPLASIGAEIEELTSRSADPVERALGRHLRAVLAFMAGDLDAALAPPIENSAPDDPAAMLVAGSAQHLGGVIALSRGDYSGARALFATAHESVTRAPAEARPSFVALALGWVVDVRGEMPVGYGEETLLLGRRVGARQAKAYVTAARALTERLIGDFDAALRLVDEAHAGFATCGDRYGTAYAAAQRGHTLRWIGEYEAAERALSEAEALRRELRDQRGVAMAVSGRSLVAAARGTGADARTLGRDAFELMERSGDVAGVTLTSANLGIVELLLGEPAAALRWINRGAELPDVPGGHRGYGWLRLLQAHVLAQLGDRAAADLSATAAFRLFFDVGEQAGLAALQRACKVGVLRLLIDTAP